MKTETAYLLRLLRAFIHGEAAPSLPNDVDGDVLSRLAQAGSVSGIVGQMVQPFADRFSDKAITFLNRQFYGTVGMYANKGLACDALFAALRAAEIPFAVVKGAVVRLLYPMPELRTFGDVDIYVPLAFREAVRDIVKDDTLLLEDAKQIYVKRPPLHVEFHFDLTSDAVKYLPKLQTYLCEMEQHFAVVKDVETVDPLYHFVYLLSHQMRHFEDDSPGIRSFLDLAVFLKSDIAPSAEVLQPLLKDLGLYAYAQVALTLTALWFGVESPLPLADIPTEDLDFLAEYIVDAGQFAREQNPRAAAVQQKGGRIKALFGALFPSPEEMRKNATYAVLARKWLPLAYAYRLYRGVFQRSEYALGAAKDIGSAEKDAAARRRVGILMGGKNIEKT